MESKTVDKTKLLTVASYAEKIGKSVQWVYHLIKEKEVNVESIDGVTFIKL